MVVDTVRQLKNNIKRIRDTKVSGDGGTLDGKWLYENKLRVLRFGEKSLVGLRRGYRNASKEKIRKMYDVCSEILANCVYSLSEEGLINELLKRQSGNEYFSLSELGVLEDVFIAVLIDRIAVSVKNELDDGFVSLSVNMLYSLGKIDFENVLSEVSVSENVLREDPAGIYERCDGATKRMYRRKLAEMGKRKGADEYKIALRYKNTAAASSGKERHIGYLLMKDSLPAFKGLYFPLLCFVPFLMSVILCSVAYKAQSIALVFVAVGVYFPLRLLVKSVIDDVLSKLTSADTVPRIAGDVILPELRTMIVYTAILSNAEKDKGLYDKVERYARAYKDKNLFFGILADLPDSDVPATLADEELKREAILKTEAINQRIGEDRVCLFLRDRTLSKSEGKYMGSERKRGAQEALLSLLSGNGSENLTISGVLPADIKYVLALDADSEIMLSDLKKLIFTAAHPSNKPEYTVKNGRMIVSSGYGIIAPRAEVSLKNADKWNRYTVLSNAFGGRSSYENAVFNVYSKLFGNGLFCGKGLISVEAYNSVLKGVFPRETILSHDIAEGLYLRCAAATDVNIYDSPPPGYLSEIKRAHRWIRGDVQSLSIAGKYVKDSSGTVSRNPLSYTNRWMLSEPLCDVLASALRLPAVLISLLCGKIGILFFFAAISDHVYKTLKSILFAFRIPRRRYLSGAPDYFDVLLFSALMPMSESAMRSVFSTDALARAIYRMKVSGRRLLEWSVFDPSGDDGNSFSKYFKKTKASVLIGGLSITASLLTEGINVLILLLNGLAWSVFPYVIYLLNRPKKTEHQKNRSEKELVNDARLMWQYFETYVTDEYNHLPPDNVSFLPDFKIAERTSPTNIGMYLMSVINAFDFGFIDSDELYRRIDNTLTTVSRLEKKWGHLYNWYDIRTCRVLYPAYVSTVDSGNFIAALITVKNGIENLGVLFASIVARIEELINNADFEKLYSKNRDLFYIGYNGADGNYDRNVYDLYTSEMLITSYYAVAVGAVPSSHFTALGRLWVDNGRASVMLSWSGGAFEYFMPSVFMPTVRLTERGEMLLSAYEEQRRNDGKFYGVGIYGRSESSFYDFDINMTYSYKAHGIGALALSRDIGRECVYAPYSMYLMSAYDDNISNSLKHLRKTDIYGKYGFYDALDMTRSRVGSGFGVTRLYMAHHVGMSIAALANLCFDNINVKRFMSEPAMGSAEHLLMDKIEICRPRSYFDTCVDLAEYSDFVPHKGIVTEKGAAVVSNGREKIIADEEGGIVLYSGNKLINQPPSRNINGLHVFILIDGTIYDCVCGGEGGRGIKSSFYSDGATIVYVNDIVHGNKLLTTELILTVSADEPRIAAKLCLHGEVSSASAMFFMLPVLNEREDYFSSPSYSDLFITTECGDNGEVIYKRKKKSDGEYYIRIHTIPENAFATFTRSDDVLFFPAEKDMLKESFYKEGKTVFGPAVHPGYMTVVPMNNRTANEAELHIFIDEDGDTEDFDTIVNKAKRQFSLTTALAGADTSALKTAFNILTALNTERTVTNIGDCEDILYQRDMFWRYGISGDLPIVVVMVSGESGRSTEFIIEDILRAKRFLFISGVRFDLVMMIEYGGYLSAETEKVRRLAKNNGCEQLIGKNNGIFFIEKEKLTKSEEMIFIAFAADVIKCGDAESVDFEKPTERDCKVKSNTDNRYGNGYKMLPGKTVIINCKHSSPWCQVYANAAFGTLLTNRTSGFTWLGNSSLGTVSKRHRDPIVGDGGESLTLSVGECVYDLLKDATKTVYGEGNAEYIGKAGNIPYNVKIGVDPRYPLKLFHVTIPSGLECGQLTLVHYPPSNVIYNGEKLIYLREDHIASTVLCVPFSSTMDVKTGACVISYSQKIKNGTYGFVLAAYPSGAHEKIVPHLENRFRTIEAIEYAFSEYAELKRKLIPELVYNGKLKNEVKMLNSASCQAVYFRMLARCGYSQPGGAYGYRDQLQDALSTLYFKPELLKYQILRSCYNQYTDGRAAHWWHTGAGGLKSKCSDDYMWLPYAVAEYIISTGDVGLLDFKIRCLSSPPLAENEDDRYEKARHTDEKYTVMQHCLMALNASFDRGNHGLPLMDTGDWNDGMNRVGSRGRGESVWLAFFFALTYRRFSEVMHIIGDVREAERLENAALELLRAAEISWDADRYLRAYDDDGMPIGSDSANECKIDIIPQAFSVFAGADRERSVISMETVYKKLFDSERGIFRLFAPSFDITNKYGYICRYPAGIRENGGQYTHAAIWAAMAYFELGAWKRGLEIISSLTPLNIYENGAMEGEYTAEPFLMCADVYYGKNITGKSGWSGYTGSAAWYYRVVMKYLIGVSVIPGGIKLTPPPEIVNGDYSYTFSYRGRYFSVKTVYGEGDNGTAEKYDKTIIISEGESVHLLLDREFVKILIKVRK